MINHTQAIDKLCRIACLTSFLMLTQAGCTKTQATQQIDKTKLSEITEQVEEPASLQKIYAKILINKGNCLAQSENKFECDEDTYYEFNLIKQTDLNGDGVKDLLVKSIESAAGFNYAVTTLHMLIMDTNNQLVENHSLLMYSQGAHNTLDIIKVDENKQNQDIELADGAYIRIKTTLNNEYEIGNAETDHTEQTIIFKNSLPYEQSYLTQCELANMTDKRIFNDEMTIKLGDVNRKTTIDATDYTQLQEEYLPTMDEGTLYQAKLHGCDNLKITFNASGSFATVKTVLSTLTKLTRFSSVFKDSVIQEYMSQTHPESDVWLYTSNGWKVNILHSQLNIGSKSSKTVTVHLTKVNNQEEQGSHWNRVLRLKE